MTELADLERLVVLPTSPSGGVHGWGVTLLPAVCEICQWRFLVSPQHWPKACPHCQQDALVPIETSAGQATVGSGPEQEAQEGEPTTNLMGDLAAELVIPFSAPENVVAEKLRRFARRVWFAPPDFAAQNLQDRLQRVFLPRWLVDGEVQAQWQGEAGYDYQVVSHRSQYDGNQGQWETRQITETRVRWELRAGRLARQYDNVEALALGEDARLHHWLGAFAAQEARTYSPAALDQAVVRLPDRSPEDAWSDADQGFRAVAVRECQQACRADHWRNFRWSPQYGSLHWSYLLLPVYMTYYRDANGVPQPVLIHGQTGRTVGRRRSSMARAGLASLTMAAVALGFFLMGLLANLVSRWEPVLLSVGTVGLMLALFVALLAIVPATWAWLFNRMSEYVVD